MVHPKFTYRGSGKTNGCAGIDWELRSGMVLLISTLTGGRRYTPITQIGCVVTFTNRWIKLISREQ